jgi:hypothetical protein
VPTKRNLTGWKRQDPATPPRKSPQIPVLLVALPTSCDVSAGMGPQLDQGDDGSCGPNSVAELRNYALAYQGVPVVTLSRMHLYWWTRFLQGSTDADSGVDNDTMMRAAVRYGMVPDEAMWPYLDANLLVKPPQSANAAGMANRLTDYADVPQDLGGMQTVIASLRPFLFGFDVFAQIESDEAADTGIVADPTGDIVGGHDVSVCGYNSSGRALAGIQAGKRWPNGYFRFRNHWMLAQGVPWGDGGYGYISYAYALSAHAADFKMIDAVLR